jgi:hypothetical protein
VEQCRYFVARARIERKSKFTTTKHRLLKQYLKTIAFQLSVILKKTILSF